MSLPRNFVQAAILLASTFTFVASQTNLAAYAAANQSVQRLTRVGTSTIKATPAGSGAYALPEIQNEVDTGLKGNAAVRSSNLQRQSNLPIPGKRSSALALAARTAAATTLPLKEPTAHSSTVVNYQDSTFIGFDGLSNIDQRTANGANQFSLEPPDQALCVGNGFVVESVNDVIKVYDTVGNALTGAEDLNTFFGLAAQIIRGTNPIVGPFVSDPKCFYDPQTKRWFVSVLEQDNGNNTGATGRNYNLLAVSQTSDPTAAFTIFQYDVTDDGLNGTVTHNGCPCFGDQPLIGTDQYGVYQSTNEFSNTTFDGAQIYAISKAKLIAAADSATPVLPLVVQIDASQQLATFGGISYTLQPARSASGNAFETSANGVEYFLSALQFGNPGYEVYDNRIAVWALTNTRTLNSNNPVLNLLLNVIHSETYGQPDPATQKPGPTPLGTSLGDPLETLNTNDDRMNQVIYSNGILYSGLNTKLKVGGASEAGIAWFAVQPNFVGPNLQATVANQGYIAVKGNNVLFPSVGVDRDGDGAIAFTLAGPDYYPSVAYTPFSDLTASQVIHIAGAGEGPEDGFTGYPQFGGNGVARWGDYSAATWDGERMWFAGEYIPEACTVNAPPCREVLFNWGTFVGSIKP